MSTPYGLFIPPAVLSQADLSLPARLVLSEVLNLYKPGGQVWANDQHFVNRLPGVALRTVGGAIKELVDAGFLVRVTKQNADPKRTLTPTALCYQALAESARGQAEEEGRAGGDTEPSESPDTGPLAESARATPNPLQNLQEPIAESAGDLLQNLQEPLADSADIKNQLNTSLNASSAKKTPASKKEVKSSSPEVKNSKGSIPVEGAAVEPWVLWLAENAPRVQLLKQPLTSNQYASLVADYGEPALRETLLGMENKADLHKKYTSANLTVRGWFRYRNILPRAPQPVAQAKAPAVPEVVPEVNERAAQYEQELYEARLAALAKEKP